MAFHYHRVYDKLDPHLQYILSSEVSLRQEEIKEYNSYLCKLLLDHLIPEMKHVDTLFNELFMQTWYSGSFYENLRIAMPNEFDLNLVLRYPRNHLKATRVFPGYVGIQGLQWGAYNTHSRQCDQGNRQSHIGRTKSGRVRHIRQRFYNYQINGQPHKDVGRVHDTNKPNTSRRLCGFSVRSQAENQNIQQIASNFQRKRRRPRKRQHMARSFSWHVRKFLDRNNFVLRNRVYSWLQSVVDKAVKKISIPDFYISRSTSGPAVTLNVIVKNLKTFSVDLVPVFAFDEPPAKPSPLITKFHQSRWYAVPKAQDGFPYTHWRMSFYDDERRIMNNKYWMKPVIKLMKLLRDIEGWHSLSSYYIKTVFLLEFWEDRDPFQHHGLGFQFMKMLVKLQGHLKKHSIPFFWDPELNLLNGMNHNESKKIGYRLDYILRTINQNIDENPGIVKRFFK